MRFLIVSHAEIKKTSEGLFGYAPYIREMNLWFKSVEEVEIISPVSSAPVSSIDMLLDHPRIVVTPVPAFSLTSFKAFVETILICPRLFWVIFRSMKRVDHIHLRCPGNMGLLGCVIQIFFPNKKKTAKYAGNWDWKSTQPWSYRLQQYILRSTLLTHNMKVLVYGEWPDRNKNIIPFFTATYSEKDRVEAIKPSLNEGLNLVFVGGLTSGKRPILALKTLQLLLKENINVRLTVCGDGPERGDLEAFIAAHNLENYISLLGNVNPERVKKEFRNAHILLFASKSEGWPKVVAESMWWGCIPITTAVSCVPQMLGEGLRGVLVEPDSYEMYNAVLLLLKSERERITKAENGKEWSQQYTLERFESEIQKLLVH